MYCVKCGVKLQDGMESCPLCGTPVWDPNRLAREHGYPDEYPREHKASCRPFAVAMTAVSALAAAVVLTVCFKLYGSLRWGGYVLGGMAFLYVIAVLPCWFRRPPAEVFVPVGHAAAALYLLFICLKTGGKWFLSFALPVLFTGCLIITAAVCLLKYVRGGKLFILGGFLLGIGGLTVLIEFLEHITFGAPMFLWSLYSLIGFAAIGGFLLLAGIIPSLRRYLEKKFFI